MIKLIGRFGAWVLFHILKGLHDIGMGKHPGFNTFVKYDIYAFIFIFLSDIHRYGAWYTGNAVHWKSWAYIVIPIMMFPIFLGVMAKLVCWIVKNNKYRMISVGLSCFVFWVVGQILYFEVYLKKSFPDPGYFVDGIIRSDGQFWITFCITTFLFGVMPFLVYYFFVKPEPGDDI